MLFRNKYYFGTVIKKVEANSVKQLEKIVCTIDFDKRLSTSNSLNQNHHSIISELPENLLSFFFFFFFQPSDSENS